LPRTPKSIRGRLLTGGVCTSLLFAAAGPARAQSDDRRALDHAISEVSDLLAEAHFQTARSVAEATLYAAGPQAGPTSLAGPRSRLHVLLATAHVALGERDLARLNLERAIRLDPKLTLDPRTTSPKLVAVLRELRPERTESPRP
jgi:hypothetical protein